MNALVKTMVVIGMAIGLPACEFDYPADVDMLDGAALRIVAGSEQSGLVGTKLGTPMLVEATAGDGSPIPDLTVDFVVAAGDGSVTEASVRTDIRGHAQTFYTLGIRPGANVVEARTPGLDHEPLAFAATALVGPPVTVSKVSTPEASAVAGSTLSPFSVLVLDQYENPTPSIAVGFVVTAGAGTLDATEVQTDASGHAAATLTLDPTVGVNRVEARVGELAPVLFETTGIAGDAARLATVSPALTSAAAGTKAPEVVVRVEDANGNGIQGHQVQLVVTQGGGSVTPATATTDALGNARAMWTLGGSVGVNKLEARATGLAGSPAVFTANGTLGQASKIALVGGNGQSAVVNTLLPNAFDVVVTDASNNPIQSYVVQFVRTTNNGAVTTGSVATNAQGRAQTTFKLGTSAGENLVEARGSGLQGSPVTFAAQGRPGSVARLVQVGGANQRIVAGMPSAPLVVRVEDSFANAVSGATVSWSVSAGFGAVQQSATSSAGDGTTSTTASAQALQNITVQASTSGAPATSFVIGVKGLEGYATFASAVATSAIIAADLNGDGRADVVTGHSGQSTNSDSLGVFMNTTAANATTATLTPRYSILVGKNIYGLVAGDFNQDGKPDVAATDVAGVKVYLNTTPKDAVVPSFATVVDFSGGYGQLAVGDLNRDGRVDIAVVAANTITLLINNTVKDATTPAFSTVPVTLPYQSTTSSSIDVVDMNADMRPDIVLPRDNGFAILYNTTTMVTTPTFTGPYPVGVDSTYQIRCLVTVGDFGGDAKPDVACLLPSQTAISINTTGTAQTTPSFSTAQKVSNSPVQSDIAAADFNADGHADLVVTLPTGFSPYQPRFGVHLMQPSGAIGPQTSFTMGDVSASSVYANLFAIGDFDGDGRVDLASVNSNNTFSLRFTE